MASHIAGDLCRTGNQVPSSDEIIITFSNLCVRYIQMTTLTGTVFFAITFNLNLLEKFYTTILHFK